MILVATFSLGSQIKPVRASDPTIYIMSDGSIQGTSSIHTSDNVTYVFTADIVNQSVVVQRSNIVIDGEGHTLQVSQDKGFYVAYVSHVTIRNVTMSDSYYGIYLFRSSGDVLTDNRITANYYDVSSLTLLAATTRYLVTKLLPTTSMAFFFIFLLATTQFLATTLQQQAILAFSLTIPLTTLCLATMLLQIPEEAFLLSVLLETF